MRKRHSSFTGVACRAILLILPMLMVWIPSGIAGELNYSDSRLINRWVTERDQAADRYVVLWLKGAAPEDLAPIGASILASEAHIATYALGDMKTLERFSILWGKKTTVETLPVLFLERRYGINLDAGRLFREEKK